MSLTWEGLIDEDDNPYYEAASAYHDDGDPFMWRVTPALRGGNIVWVIADSTYELVCSDLDRQWDTSDEAKAFCQHENDEILKQFQEGEE